MIKGLEYQKVILTVEIIFFAIHISNHHIICLKHVQFLLKGTNPKNKTGHTMLNIGTPNNGGIKKHEAQTNKLKVETDIHDSSWRC